MSQLQNCPPPQNRPFEANLPSASSPAPLSQLGGRPPSALDGPAWLPSKSAAKSSIFRGREVLQLALICLFLTLPLSAASKVQLGVDAFFQGNHLAELKGMKVGLVTNHTGVSGQLKMTLDLFREAAKEFKLAAIFTPEHGLTGVARAGEHVDHSVAESVRVYSLHGSHRRPTAEMLDGIDVLIYDIQDIGSRPYTYATTLFYIMEEAAKYGIDVIVLDRPNPINGLVVDGPMLDPECRSFLGYINVPYCHGMTIGELARFFNTEYHVGCSLKVVPMKGWKREMTFQDTGLTWVPTSPQIPEMDSPYFFPMTGMLGELEIVNIGVNYMLPFKIVGAPWINAKKFASVLNAQNLPGVAFMPFYYKPFAGPYKNEECNGVKIIVTDHKTFRPVAVDYLIIGVLKTLYPKLMAKKLQGTSETKKIQFMKISGTPKIFHILNSEKYVVWKLINFQSAERNAFMEKREKYLLY